MAHVRGRHEHLERDREPATSLIGIIVQVGKRYGIAGCARKSRRAKWRERFERHEPRRHGGRKVFCQEGPQGLVFPRLHVARRPIIDEAEPRDVRLRLADRDGGAERITVADERSHLQLVVETSRGAKDRRDRHIVPGLTLGPAHRGAAGHKRRCAAMISDWDPLVVRQECVVRAEHAADVRCVMNRRIEVGVVSHARRNQKLRVRHRNKERAAQVLCAPAIFRVGAEKRADDRAQPTECRPAFGEQRVKGSIVRTLVDGRREGVVEHALLRHRDQVENLITDRHAGPRRPFG